MSTTTTENRAPQETGKPRIPLAEAEPIANEIRELLAPACERIVIAGSIRRRKSEVGDIELLTIPKLATVPSGGLWGDDQVELDLLAARTDELLVEGTIQRHVTVVRQGAWGTRQRQFRFRGCQVDLFWARPETWGVLLAIRTGPSDYSQWLVTDKRHGGALPGHLQVRDGLRYRTGGELIPCPTETSFFEAIGINRPRPWERKR